MMKSLAGCSRGGHVGEGGIQAWSAGDIFPWTIYTIEHNLPAGKAPEVQDRFLWAEIRMSHPDGRDLLLADYFRGDDDTKKAEAHRKASRVAERALRMMNVMDSMQKVLSYGRKEVAEVVTEALADALTGDAECGGPIQVPVPVANTDLNFAPPVVNTAVLFRNEGGMEECKEVDYYGGGCSTCEAADVCDSSQPGGPKPVEHAPGRYDDENLKRLGLGGRFNWGV